MRNYYLLSCTLLVVKVIYLNVYLTDASITEQLDANKTFTEERDLENKVECKNSNSSVLKSIRKDFKNYNKYFNCTQETSETNDAQFVGTLLKSEHFSVGNNFDDAERKDEPISCSNCTKESTIATTSDYSKEDTMALFSFEYTFTQSPKTIEGQSIDRPTSASQSEINSEKEYATTFFPIAEVNSITSISNNTSLQWLQKNGTENLANIVDLYNESFTTDNAFQNKSEDNTKIHQGFLWPVKKEAVVEGDVIIGGLMMVHEREDTITCGPVMPQGGIQALETLLYTVDRINSNVISVLPNITLGAHVLDDCDKDTYGLEMAVDFIKDIVDVTQRNGIFCLDVLPCC